MPVGDNGVKNELAARLETVTRHLRMMHETVQEALVAVGHGDKESDPTDSPRDGRSASIVRRLLAGHPVTTAEERHLDYAISGRWHIGLVVRGEAGDAALRHLKTALGCELLLLHDSDLDTLAWLGARRELDIDLRAYLAFDAVASGEPAYGLVGWRQTHREAQAAILASIRSGRFARYGDEPLLAAALENETLYAWLKRFVAPLREHPDGLELMRTARAYLDAECNSSSAAHALKNVRRQTVGSRMRAVEALVQRPLRECLSELDAALCLEELDASGPGAFR